MIERSVLVHYRTEEAKAYRRKHPSCGRFRQRMEINVLGITNTLTSVGKDNMAYIGYE